MSKCLLRWIIGVTLIVAAIIAVKEFHFATELKRVIEQSAIDHGITGLSINDIDIGVGSAEIHEVKLNTLDQWDGKIKADKITIEYNLINLLTTKSIKKITISGAKLRIDTSKPINAQVTALKKLIPDDTKQQSSSITLPQIDIKDAKIVIQHDKVKIKIPIDGSIAITDNNIKFTIYSNLQDNLEAKFIAKGQYVNGKFDSTIECQAIDYDKDSIKSAFKNLKIALTANSQITAKLNCTIDKVMIENYGSLAQSVILTLDLITNNEEINIDASLNSDDKNKILTITGTNAFKDSQKSLNIQMNETALSDIWTMKDTLSELLDQEIENFDGKLSINGTVNHNGKKFNSDLKIHLNNCNVATSDTKISNIATALHITAPFPLQFADSPVITADSVKTDKIELRNTKLFPVINDNEFRIKRIETNTLGGRAVITKLKPINVGKHNGYEFAMTLHGIEMKQLFKVAQVNGLSGNAKLDGSAAARIYGKIFDIQHAKLKSISDLGLLQYNPTGEPAKTDTPTPENLTMEVLKNLNFTRLNVSLKRKDINDNKLQANIKITGYNKDILNGHPFEFNITTTGALDKLIKTSLMDLSRPQDVEAIKELIENQNPRRSE